jgi:hypothetical protein
MVTMEPPDPFLRPPAPDIENNNKNNNSNMNNINSTKDSDNNDSEMNESSDNKSYTNPGTEAYANSVIHNINHHNAATNTITTMTTTIDNNNQTTTIPKENTNNLNDMEVTDEDQKVIMEYIDKLEQMDTASFDAIPEHHKQILLKYMADEAKVLNKETAFKLIERTKSGTHRKNQITQSQSQQPRKAYQNPFTKPSTNPFSALDDSIDNPIMTPKKTNVTTDPPLVTQIDTPKLYSPTKPTSKPTTGLRPNSTQYGGKYGYVYGRGGSGYVHGRGGNPGRSQQTKTDSSSDSDTTIKSNNTLTTNHTIQPTNQDHNDSSTTIIDNLATTTTDETTPIPPIKRRDPENLHSFSLHLTIRPHKGQTLPESNAVINHILKALQSRDSTIKLLSIPDTTKQRISVRSLFTSDTNELISHHQRFTQSMQLNPRGVLSGNIWFTGSLRYSSIKKSTTYRQQLTSKYYIFVTLNNIGATIPIDIGFFIHKLYRHDTVENKQYIEKILPPNSPPFQPEQTIIWAGPRDNRRSTSVIKICTRQQDSDAMSKIFEERFHNTNHMTFVRQSYFNCLSPEEKLQFVESQNAYITQHRTYLLRGLRNIDLPTKHAKPNKFKVTIREWLYTLKTNTQECIFIDIQIPINDAVEVTFKTIHFDVVKQWERDCIAHIAREVDSRYYTQVFTNKEDDFDLLLTFTTPWEPPIPQQINFLVQKKSAWTNTYTAETTTTKDPPNKQTNRQHPKSLQPPSTKSIQPPKQITTSDDNNTITTVTEYQDQIIELQELSKQQSQRITAQQQRLDAIERQYQELTNIEQLQERFTTIDNNYRNTSTELKNMNQELTGLNKTTTFISSTVQKQQQDMESQQQQTSALEQQLQSLLANNTDTTNKTRSNNIQTKIFHEMHKKQRSNTRDLRTDLEDQQAQIDNLIHTISAIRSVNPSLFPTLSRKRPKQRTPNTSVLDNEDTQSDNNSNMSRDPDYYSNDEQDNNDEITENELSFFDTNSPGAESSNDSNTESMDADHNTNAPLIPTATEAESNLFADSDLDSIGPGRDT